MRPFPRPDARQAPPQMPLGGSRTALGGFGGGTRPGGGGLLWSALQAILGGFGGHRQAPSIPTPAAQTVGAPINPSPAAQVRNIPQSAPTLTPAPMGLKRMRCGPNG